MSVLWKIPELPPANPETVLRYARGNHTESVDEVLSSALREGSEVLDPKLCYDRFSIRFSDHDVVDFGQFSVQSRDLFRHLSDTRETILFAATVGPAADRLIARAERTSPTKALLLDAFFSERVEALCDLFTAGYNRPSCRFSPGYGDLPLSFQKDIFRILDIPRRIGVTLGDSLLMIPTKSVTAIIGVKED